MQLFKAIAGIAASLCLVLTISAGHAANKTNIVETAEKAGNFTILVKALKQTGLDKELETEGPYTVFAPTDEAFQKLGQKKLDELMMPENKDQLASILKYHVVSGNVHSNELAGKKTEVTTIDQRMLSVDGREGVKIEKATVVTPDVAASNGTIHVIDSVLIP